MNKISKYTVIILLLFSFKSFCQTPYRQVLYSTNTSKVFGVPVETDMSLISNFDFAKMIAEDKIENTEMVIGGDQQLTITTYYPQLPRYENDYEFGVGKSVTYKYGTILYDHENKILSQTEEVESDPNFTIDLDAIDNYGLYPIFEVNISDLVNLYTELGFTTNISEEGVFSAINDTLEFYLDTTKLIMETRIFKDGILEVSDWKQYQTIDKYTIPLVSVLTTYDNLTKGIRLQISEIQQYLKYSIIDKDGKSIVNYETKQTTKKKNDDITISQYEGLEKKISNLVVYPNPACDKIEVEVPLYISDFINIEIINTLGTIVYAEKNVKSGNKTTIDISDLKNGVYLLRCGKGGLWKTIRFVKQ